MARKSTLAVLLLALGLVAAHEHHHQHNQEVQTQTEDFQVKDYSQFTDYEFDDQEQEHDDEVFDYESDSPLVETGTWNKAGTVKLVKEFEGCRLTAYQDSVGVWTIGYGHTGSDVHRGLTITQARAEELLANDLQKFVNCVTSYVKVPLNPNQNGALVSFSYNVGCGNLQSSTLLRRLNAHENPNTVASQELPKWVFAGGKKLPGLVRRRDAEVAFFKS